MKRTSNIPIGDSVNKQLLAIAKKFGGGYVRVGFLEDKKYPDGTPVAQVAYWDEFGHGGNFPSPPRSFFREMVKKYSPEWPKILGVLAEQNDYNGTVILAAMGKILEEQLRNSIRETNSPPLSPTTVLLHLRFPGTAEFNVTIQDVLKAQEDIRNGAVAPSGTVAKPLVWSGTMLAAVGSEVTK